MFKLISISKIYSTSNVRKEQDDSILDLMGDIQRNGLLQPIVVRDDGNGKYEVIAGHRRLLAMKNLGEDSIECNILEDCSDKDRFILQLSENVQRRQMSAYELCMAFDSLREKYGCTDVQISKLLHKSPNYVAEKKLSAGIIKASAKKKAEGKSIYTMGNGWTCQQQGHSYIINCINFEFEQALNELMKERK